MATQPAMYRINADQFLAMDFTNDDKVELDNGVIRMMGGGTRLHALVSGNVFLALGMKLRGTGCRPYGSDAAVRINDFAVRYPDVTVYCGEQVTNQLALEHSFSDPRLIVEVLSPGTANHDQSVKLVEYRGIASVDAILFIDTETERVRIIERTAPERWTDEWLPAGADVVLASLSLTLTAKDIFARD